MLARSFLHLPGIGERTERKLWERGVASWAELRRQPAGRVPAWALEAALDETERAWSARDAGWFGAALPQRQAWRVYREFRDDAAYVDIETTGSSRGSDSVTCIAVADRRGVRTFVRGRNLEAFPTDIRDYAMVVTFNGAAFDLPFLRDAFPGLTFERQAHFDLCPALRKLGHRGGLKRIEKELGVPRDEGLDGVDGWIAVDLWARHLGGDPRALPTLERYCAEDVLGLPALAALAANSSLGATPFAAELEPLPVPRRIEAYLPFSRAIVADALAAREALERRAVERAAERERWEPPGFEAEPL